MQRPATARGAFLTASQASRRFDPASNIGPAILSIEVVSDAVFRKGNYGVAGRSIEPQISGRDGNGVILILHPLTTLDLREENFTVGEIQTHLIQWICAFHAKHLFIIPKAMDINSEQPITLQNAAHDLITYPPPGSGVLASKHARHRGIFETVTKKILERFVAFPLGRFEHTAVKKTICFSIFADSPAFPDVPNSPHVFLIMEGEKRSSCHPLLLVFGTHRSHHSGCLRIREAVCRSLEKWGHQAVLVKRGKKIPPSPADDIIMMATLPARTDGGAQAATKPA
ncbi:hypothetical protein EMIT0P12_10463 [Pseudomonas sp. IT-P12]